MGYPVRPSGYIGWGSTGMTNVAEPIDSKKAAGWAGNEKPPSSYFNWLHAKQDEWLQYLDWKSRLEVVISDDFNYASNAPGGSASGAIGATLYPQWFISVSGVNSAGRFINSLGFNAAYLEPINGAPEPLLTPIVGGVAIYGGHLAQIFSRVGHVYGRDFSAEAVMLEWARSPSNTSAEWGMFHPSSPPTGSTGLLLGVRWTGQSGVANFTWTPSGGSPTSFASSGIVYQAWKRYSIESRGPTLAFYIDNTLVGAAPAVMFGASGVAEHFGARVHGLPAASTPTGFGPALFIDKMELKMVRSPT